MHCGKPARCKTAGWVEYYCEDCVRRVANSPVGDMRLARDDIPELLTYNRKTLTVEECESEAEAAALLKLKADADNAHFYKKEFSDKTHM